MESSALPLLPKTHSVLFPHFEYEFPLCPITFSMKPIPPGYSDALFSPQRIRDTGAVFPFDRRISKDSEEMFVFRTSRLVENRPMHSLVRTKTMRSAGCGVSVWTSLIQGA